LSKYWGSSTQDDPGRSNIGGREPCNPCGIHAYDHTAKLKKVHDTVHSTVFPQLCKIFTDFNNFFTGRQSSKPVLIWLFTIPPHLRYVTTAPCNLSLVTSLVCDCHAFSDTNVLQGSAATHEMWWDH